MEEKHIENTEQSPEENLEKTSQEEIEEISENSNSEEEEPAKLFEEKLFVVEESYTEKDYLTYCKYRYQKGQKWLKVVWVVYLLFAAYQIIDSLLRGALLLTALGIILMGIGIWMLFVGSYFIPYRRTLKQSKNFFARRVISFYENHLECETDGNVRSSDYENLSRIFETGDAFYLIIGKGSVLMVFKNCVTQGTPEELSRFLHHITDRLNS